MLGIIGGSGLYAFEGFEGAWATIRTPFGDPSDALFVGQLDGRDAVFLPRHGRGHRIPPAEINYRANIAALKLVGVTDVVSVSAVGSLREDLPPGALVLVDQFIDQTRARPRSFFGPGLVAHVSLADPVCARLQAHLRGAAARIGEHLTVGATAITIEGPQFSTRAESRLWRQWGCDVIGMTSLPEARLAREAELCYATLALVTDYDAWHATESVVTVDAVLARMQQNVLRARALLRAFAADDAPRPHPCPSGCDRALDTAVATPPPHRDAAQMARVAPIAGRVFPSVET